MENVYTNSNGSCILLDPEKVTYEVIKDNFEDLICISPIPGAEIIEIYPFSNYHERITYNKSVLRIYKKHMGEIGGKYNNPGIRKLFHDIGYLTTAQEYYFDTFWLSLDIKEVLGTLSEGIEVKLPKSSENITLPRTLGIVEMKKNVIKKFAYDNKEFDKKKSYYIDEHYDGKNEFSRLVKDLDTNENIR